MPEIHDDDACLNPSTAPHFGEVVHARLSRRAVLAGGLATAAAYFAAGPAAAIVRAPGAPKPLLGFTPITRSTEDAIRIPDGYTATAFIPWGTPILAPYPAFKPGANSAADQERQLGMHHDGLHFFPIRGSSREGLLVLNHEYADEIHLQTGTALGPLPPVDTWTLEHVRRSQAAHGVSVVQIRRGREWEVVRGRYNRRITANTPMTFAGPARGHRLLKTAADPSGTRPLGTFNNCANGFTPWGTYLTCEENFNQYFALTKPVTEYSPEAQDLIKRYGIGGDKQRWATKDPRFAVGPTEQNEPNRFGWVVEIDPFDPTSTPIKRTALGRIKHEGAWVVVARDGRVVVYMGDDQVNEFAYKFVSAKPWRQLRARKQSPLDAGTLYVAKFNDDGTGTWLPLVHGQSGLTQANGFADQGEVLIKTRQAATLLGATPMDRPEWVATNPTTRSVYLTCTNHAADAANPKTPSAVNPRTPNPFGHIVCWQEKGGDYTGLEFAWNLLAMGGAGFGSGDGSTIAAEDAFGSPDGLWADPFGRLWIQTDHKPGQQPGEGGGNNQMLCADLTTRPAAAPGSTDAVPEIRRFLTGPNGCEITGITATPDHRTMFLNVQHPGEEAHLTPANASTWPNLGPTDLPRSATVVITKNDGGVIGT
ncbi:MAG: PhoX family protein [Sporichthyaceae bacterium]